MARPNTLSVTDGAFLTFYSALRAQRVSDFVLRLYANTCHLQPRKFNAVMNRPKEFQTHIETIALARTNMCTQSSKHIRIYIRHPMVINTYAHTFVYHFCW